MRRTLGHAVAAAAVAVVCLSQGAAVAARGEGDAPARSYPVRYALPELTRLEIQVKRLPGTQDGFQLSGKLEAPLTDLPGATLEWLLPASIEPVGRAPAAIPKGGVLAAGKDVVLDLKVRLKAGAKEESVSFAVSYEYPWKAVLSHVRRNAKTFYPDEILKDQLESEIQAMAGKRRGASQAALLRRKR
jgi:hypothetical protein